jgi:hypothetical protein
MSLEVPGAHAATGGTEVCVSTSSGDGMPISSSRSVRLRRLAGPAPGPAGTELGAASAFEGGGETSVFELGKAGASTDCVSKPSLAQSRPGLVRAPLGSGGAGAGAAASGAAGRVSSWFATETVASARPAAEQESEGAASSVGARALTAAKLGEPASVGANMRESGAFTVVASRAATPSRCVEGAATLGTAVVA